MKQTILPTLLGEPLLLLMRPVFCPTCGTWLGDAPAKDAGQSEMSPAIKRLCIVHASNTMTSAKCLEWLWVECGAACAANPSTPPETLKILSEVYPTLVRKNPSTQLLTLEPDQQWATALLQGSIK